MLDQIEKYLSKLTEDRSSCPDNQAIAAQDDVVVFSGEPLFSHITKETLKSLGCFAVVVAKPALPFADYLLQRARDHECKITPRDTESRTFLHDIPIIRKKELENNPARAISARLAGRRGVIAEGIGIIAAGTLTVEQAYINWSSVFHSTFVKYLSDILNEGFTLSGEADAFISFRNDWLRPLTSEGLEFRKGPIKTKEDILDEVIRVGRYVERRGLVDSFFGNISYACGNLLYISQTASSLDNLSGCIDPVPFDDSSTVGITASSELAAHRAIIEKTGCRAILHGHPRFAVVMSMLCGERESCAISDCWKDCPKIRFLGNTPVVAGEIGAGGLAKNVSPVIGKTGQAIVYGHGVFSIGGSDFAEAFRGMINVENFCRNEYFKLLDNKN